MSWESTKICSVDTILLAWWPLRREIGVLSVGLVSDDGCVRKLSSVSIKRKKLCLHWTSVRVIVEGRVYTALGAVKQFDKGR